MYVSLWFGRPSPKKPAHVFITELNGAMKINGDAKLPDQNQLGMKDRDVENQQDLEAGSDIKLEEEDMGLTNIETLEEKEKREKPYMGEEFVEGQQEMEAEIDIELEEEHDGLNDTEFKGEKEKGNDDITIINKYWDNEKEDSLSSTEWSKIATTI